MKNEATQFLTALPPLNHHQELRTVISLTALQRDWSPAYVWKRIFLRGVVRH